MDGAAELAVAQVLTLLRDRAGLVAPHYREDLGAGFFGQGLPCLVTYLVHLIVVLALVGRRGDRVLGGLAAFLAKLVVGERGDGPAACAATHILHLSLLAQEVLFAGALATPLLIVCGLLQPVLESLALKKSADRSAGRGMLGVPRAAGVGRHGPVHGLFGVADLEAGDQVAELAMGDLREASDRRKPAGGHAEGGQGFLVRPGRGDIGEDAAAIAVAGILAAGEMDPAGELAAVDGDLDVPAVAVGVVDVMDVVDVVDAVDAVDGGLGIGFEQGWNGA